MVSDDGEGKERRGGMRDGNLLAGEGLLLLSSSEGEKFALFGSLFS